MFPSRLSCLPFLLKGKKKKGTEEAGNGRRRVGESIHPNHGNPSPIHINVHSGFMGSSSSCIPIVEDESYFSCEEGNDESSCKNITTLPEEPDVYCQICMEPKFKKQCFSVKNCSHLYCSSCVAHYIEAKLEENVISIGCPDPGCKDGYVEPEMCRDLLKPDVFNRWGIALCEAAVGSVKFYCPFRDCSALLIHEGKGKGKKTEAITKAECPHCSRMFCAECNVPWHAGATCSEFKKLGVDERGRDDIKLMKLAKARKWKRCSRCKSFVEKVGGCMFVRCRCGYQFFYGWG